MKKISDRYLKEEATRFVITQEGDNQNDEYYLTSENHLVPDPFDKNIKFFTSAEQARNYAEKAYVPEYLSESDFEYAVQSGIIAWKEIK